MIVEIWSDVMCPFCYIGKRKFEKALNLFEGKHDVEIIWRSFQLDPTTVTNPSLSVIEHLATNKGWSIEQTEQMVSQVTDIANEVGLVFNFNKAVVANSFKAHRLSHLAKKFDLQNQLEEALFSAYFTEGKNTDDRQDLLDISISIGLPSIEVLEVLDSNLFSTEVKSDIDRARNIGVRGVPFFVFNNTYAVSGAQDYTVFLDVLRKEYS